MIILGVPLALVTHKPARSPTLSALPPGFPAAHTGPLSSPDFCTGFTLTLLCLQHPHSWGRSPSLVRAQQVSDVHWSQRHWQGPTASMLLPDAPQAPEPPKEGPRVQHFPNSELHPAPGAQPRQAPSALGSYLLRGVAPQAHGVGNVRVYLRPVTAPFYPLQHLQAAQEHPAVQGAGRHGDLWGTGTGGEEGTRGSPSRQPPRLCTTTGKRKGRNNKGSSSATGGRATCAQRHSVAHTPDETEGLGRGVISAVYSKAY